MQHNAGLMNPQMLVGAGGYGAGLAGGQMGAQQLQLQQQQQQQQQQEQQGGQQGQNADPSAPLTMIAPASAFSGEAGRYPWYRVAYAGGVDLRYGPSVEAPKTGDTLCQNATIAAAEEVLGQDQRVYLRLADGRGWAFDDSALFPHDPSVVRGYWRPVALATPGQGQQQ
eukprot:TRINITY_DN2414_c1_g1_i1.p1 TRINITY_DN2414_c1_g1~~TRINITY_DN2414_c1_g1_i1.p1  ORF type:complete len:169 (-),score=41.04 TRINITY_DN2414_c1_g1_i1:66-572(-)